MIFKIVMIDGRTTQGLFRYANGAYIWLMVGLERWEIAWSEIHRIERVNLPNESEGR